MLMWRPFLTVRRLLPTLRTGSCACWIACLVARHLERPFKACGEAAGCVVVSMKAAQHLQTNRQSCMVICCCLAEFSVP